MRAGIEKHWVIKLREHLQRPSIVRADIDEGDIDFTRVDGMVRSALAIHLGREEDPLMVKTLRCRLRLHQWEDRENPETQERYQVCRRCNAYRDRGNAAPGAGAAGITGSGMG